MTYTDLEQWILAFIAIATPSVFIGFCMFMKPHKSHVWELQQALFTPPKEEKETPKGKTK